MIAQLACRSAAARKRPRQKGAAMVELTIVLPLLILLFSGLLEAGRVLAELNWLSQTAYQLTYVLGGSPRGTGASLMNTRYQQLVDNIRKYRFPSLGLDAPPPVFRSSWDGSFYDDANKSVGLRFSASIKPLSSLPIQFPMNIEVTGPYLLAATEASGLGTFANPALLFNCCGVECPEGWGKNCENAACDPVPDC